MKNGGVFMYDCDRGCDCDRELYRGDMYDICRARLGRPRGQACLQLKFLLLGVIVTSVGVLLISCCIK